MTTEISMLLKLPMYVTGARRWSKSVLNVVSSEGSIRILKVNTFAAMTVTIAWIMLPSAVLAAGSGVHVGDSEDRVVEVLGPPQGRLVRGDLEFLYYERGVIEVERGNVTAADLLSEEDAELRRIQRERDLAERAEAARKRKQRLLDEGTAEKSRILSDPTFAERAIREQVAYWKGFRGQYPDVDVQDEYRTALRELQEQERVERLRAEKERLLAEDPGPKPKVSRQKKRKMQRAGLWKW